MGMMRNQVLCAAVFSTMLIRCSADTYSNMPVADAFVATGTSTNDLSGDNFGAAGSLTVEAANLPKGEFQSIIEFDLAAAQSYFNSEYGVGAWSVQTVSLVLTASAHTNAMFNPPAAGAIGISLMQNNSWVEGTGTGGDPTTNGISYNSLESTYIDNETDQALGTFTFVGGTAGTAAYVLGLTPGVISDVTGGRDMSLRLFPADTVVSYLFNSRMASPAPALLVTATMLTNAVELAVALSGTNLALSWPTNQAANLVLQQNSDLATTNWSATPTNSLVVAHGQYQIFAAPTNTQQYFRLVAP